MKEPVYKSKEERMNARTNAQFEAMNLKHKGYKATRLMDGDDLVAFGYNPKGSAKVTHRIEDVKKGDYEFIFWN